MVENQDGRRCHYKNPQLDHTQFNLVYTLITPFAVHFRVIPPSALGISNDLFHSSTFLKKNYLFMYACLLYEFSVSQGWEQRYVRNVGKEFTDVCVFQRIPYTQQSVIILGEEYIKLKVN